MGVVSRRPWERIEGKIQAWHRDRLAVVYVRQSTPAQVVDHSESTRLQYGQAERAVALGWAPSRVLVIDDDLGHSASGVDSRPGLGRLVAEVGLDHVGIVLGIEMSRLARSGREWHQLLELCALSGALLGDADGVYDPAEHNDRLLLGLKGTISEAELHLIKQRMWTGRIAKARRGELAMPVPAGFVRRPGGQVALDPGVRITVAGTSEKVDIEVSWAGGHRSAAQIARPVACLTQLSYYPELACRARQLVADGATTAQIAETLNAEGFRPPKRARTFTRNAVTDLLRTLGITRGRNPRTRPALAEHEWWLRDLAEHIGMSEITLDSWVRRGWTTGYLHPTARGANRPRRPTRDRATTRPAPGPARTAQPTPLADQSGRQHQHRTGRTQP